MLGRKKTDEQSLLCIDIGASSVRATVFQKAEAQLELKGSSHVAQEHGNIQQGAIINVAQTIAHVQEAVKKAENMAKRSPRDVIIGVSGELVKGLTVTLQYVRTNTEKRIDAQELKTIIHELEWQAFDLVRRELSDEMCVPEMELKLINAAIVSIRVDHQPVSDPRGITGEVVEMDIFNCFAPVQHFGQIQNIAIELPYHQLKGVFIQSFAICHCLGLKNALESAIVIDIGAGTTDVGVILDGRVAGTRSFSLGGNTFTKRISYELSTSFDQAEAIKLSYCRDDLEKKSMKVIHDALLADIDIWIHSLDFCLKELVMKKLPNKIFLCGRASGMKEISDALSHHDWEHHFPVSGKVEIRPLRYSDIFPEEDEEVNYDPEYLPLLAVANTAYDLLYAHKSIEDILSGIIADRGL